MTRPDETLGLYIHVPFCRSKCPYCDFYSLRPGAGEAERYVDAVAAALSDPDRFAGFLDASVFDRRIESVYFGGGTPSLLPPAQILRLLDAVRARFSLAPDAEITLECNPSLSDPGEYFRAVKAAGVNRVSIGMQSGVDSERRQLGRLATGAQVAACVDAAKRAGIGDLSLDLMLGVPGQTEKTAAQSLDAALAMDVTHLSVYLLSIEAGTVFDRRRASLALPDEDTAAALYLETCRRLEEAGWRHYEISNFCRDGRVGRHNLRYWQGGDYLGIGPAAHSFYQGCRFYFPRDLSGFLEGQAPVDDGAGGDAAERLMLALRTDEGIDPAAFFAAFSLGRSKAFDALWEKLAAAGLARTGGRLALTDRGMAVSNAVILSLMETLGL